MRSVIDIGDAVLCDLCNADYTESDQKGGLVLNESAVCPICQPDIEASVKKYGEEGHINARCPAEMSFKQFILAYRPNNSIIIETRDKIRLSEGDKITVFGIGGFMANTTKTEWTVMGKEGDRYIGRPRGKRKQYYIALDNEKIVLRGWDCPVKVDSEIRVDEGSFTRSTFRGNACYNLAGVSIEQLKALIETQINPLFDKMAHILHIEGDKETIVYPELETSHAVINRMKRCG